MKFLRQKYELMSTFRDEINEKSLDYVLPSKKIKSFKSSPKEIFAKGKKKSWKRVDRTIIDKLKVKSQKRIAENKDFIKIKESLAELKKKEKDKKYISIAEVLKEKDKKEDEEKIEEKSEKEEDKEKYFSRPDVLEALNIAKDLAFFQKEKASKKISSSVKNLSL